jgi:tRNA pseudouridine synthase 10
MRVEDVTDDRVTLMIHAESGTYIKELITGDGGRTAPSLQQLAHCPIEMQTLDVVHIGDEDGEKIERIKEQDQTDTAKKAAPAGPEPHHEGAAAV